MPTPTQGWPEDGLADTRELADTKEYVEVSESETFVETADTVVSPETVGPTVVMATPAPAPPEHPDDRFGLGLLIGVLIFAAIGAVIAAVLLTRHNHRNAATTVVVTTGPATTAPPAGSSVLVPNLVGQSEANVVSTLRSEGFVPQVVTVSGPPPAGRVVSETPAPGQNEPTGTTIEVGVSDGTAANTTTTTATTTTTTTVQATTSVTTTTTVHSTTSAPPVATPTKPTTTTTTTAVPAQVQVPAVSGDLQAAVQTLGKAGFLVAVHYVPGSDPLGTVEDQNPAGGTTTTTGSRVLINVSSGPGQKPEETVPDTVGQTIPQAVSTMQQAGLRLIYLKKPVSDRSLGGTVVEQTPAAGRTAPKNAQILVYMGAFK